MPQILKTDSRLTMGLRMSANDSFRRDRKSAPCIENSCELPHIISP
jgi:hypothetical protein